MELSGGISSLMAVVKNPKSDNDLLKICLDILSAIGKSPVTQNKIVTQGGIKEIDNLLKKQDT
jgi:hypothetical protein